MPRRCNMDDQPLSEADQQTLADFAAFLTDRTSRCPICLSADHTQATDCPEVN